MVHQSGERGPETVPIADYGGPAEFADDPVGPGVCGFRKVEMRQRSRRKVRGGRFASLLGQLIGIEWGKDRCVFAPGCAGARLPIWPGKKQHPKKLVQHK